MERTENPDTFARQLAVETERLKLQILYHQRIAGRTLTLDEAREVCRIADASVKRERF